MCWCIVTTSHSRTERMSGSIRRLQATHSQHKTLYDLLCYYGEEGEGAVLWSLVVVWGAAKMWFRICRPLILDTHREVLVNSEIFTMKNFKIEVWLFHFKLFRSLAIRSSSEPTTLVDWILRTLACDLLLQVNVYCINGQLDTYRTNKKWRSWNEVQ